MRRVPFVFENLAPAGDPHRDPAQVSLEANALVNNHRRDRDRPRPKVAGFAECIHRPMPVLDGYVRTRSVRNLSRANVALYTRKGLELGPVEWVDLEKTWRRPVHPQAGPHEPRSILLRPVEDWLVVVAHAPQVGPGIEAARAEWLEAIAAICRRPGPILVLSDPNGLGDDLVRRVPRLQSGGTATDAVHVAGGTVSDVRLPETVNGVPMLTDHRHALIGLATRS